MVESVRATKVQTFNTEAPISFKIQFFIFVANLLCELEVACLVLPRHCLMLLVFQNEIR